MVKEDTVLRPAESTRRFSSLRTGFLTIFLGKIPIENATPGDFFGEESILRGTRELPRGWEERFASQRMRNARRAAARQTFSRRARCWIPRCTPYRERPWKTSPSSSGSSWRPTSDG